MVAYVLERVAMGTSWKSISADWRDAASEEAIAEAVRLAGLAFSEHAGERVIRASHGRLPLWCIRPETYINLDSVSY